MRKHVILASSLAILIAALPLSASADRGHRGHGWDGRGDWDRWERRHHRFHRRLNKRQWRRHHRRAWNNRWRNRWYYHPRYRYDYYPFGWRSGFATGAIIGSSIHRDRFYDDRDRRDRDRITQDRGEISGCFKVERLPDGSERRIELPLSDCRF
ncbi:MAG: hypothetical protein AAGI88_17530 [Pseudomonadota bacterium]